MPSNFLDGALLGLSTKFLDVSATPVIPAIFKPESSALFLDSG